jgi:hypothetical protein
VKVVALTPHLRQKDVDAGLTQPRNQIGEGDGARVERRLQTITANLLSKKMQVTLTTKVLTIQTDSS